MFRQIGDERRRHPRAKRAGTRRVPFHQPRPGRAWELAGDVPGCRARPAVVREIRRVRPPLGLHHGMAANPRLDLRR
jgi:hypothetical protein